ncbi:formate/nitrite transporter family protein [Roseovarius aquimarinus]|uniref:Formate/nitrite transporter family protein n=1 Tax=Roseovarius aquimarinus TaxID=1229156 RepID=A0ABW7I493_9RHOB
MSEDDETSPSEERAHQRERREKTRTETEQSLTGSERDAVTQNSRLSALTVYSIILRDGLEELDRPTSSLWWSGVAAGIGISSSVLVESILRKHLGSGHPHLTLLGSLGYTFGFVLVILSRLQLFTENTITVVLPLLTKPGFDRLSRTARLWGIVFTANLIGTFFTALLAVHAGFLPEGVLQATLEISRHLTELSPAESLLRGIPAGFFIAAIVWMLPSAKGSSVLVIVMFTWLIAAGEFTHVIAGSNEIFTLVLVGEVGFFEALALYIAPVLIGNILGGTGLFAMLAYGQIRNEM